MKVPALAQCIEAMAECILLSAHLVPVWGRCCLPVGILRNPFRTVRLPPRRHCTQGHMAHIASVTQPSKVSISVAQELTEAPFGEQYYKGKGDHFGVDPSAICQLCDYSTSSASIYLSVKCG